MDTDARAKKNNIYIYKERERERERERGIGNKLPTLQYWESYRSEGPNLIKKIKQLSPRGVPAEQAGFAPVDGHHDAVAHAQQLGEVHGAPR